MKLPFGKFNFINHICELLNFALNNLTLFRYCYRIFSNLNALSCLKRFFLNSTNKWAIYALTNFLPKIVCTSACTSDLGEMSLCI